MSKLDVHFSSKRGDHRTPKDFFNLLHKEFKFKADLYASKSNRLCPIYFSLENPAEYRIWPFGYSFANPPYGKAILEALNKAAQEQARGAYSVFLLPARTDTKWFHEFVMNYASSIRFIRGRLTFEGNPAPAPFPSMLVIFGPEIPGNGGPRISTMDRN